MPSLLEAISFFSELPADVQRDILPLFRVRPYQKNEMIIEETSEGSSVFFILSGCVRISQCSENGHEVIYNLCKKGEIFGELAVLDDLPRSASAYALEPSEVASISASDFHNILKTHSDISLKIMQHLSSIVRRLNQRLKRCTTDSAQTRVYAYIAEQACRIKKEENGRAVFIPLPKQALLASMLDVSRETVARALSILAKEKIISKESGGLCLLESQKLADLVGDIGIL